MYVSSKAVERLSTCVEALEPSLLDNAIRTKISLAGLYFVRSAMRAASQLPGSDCSGSVVE